MLWQILRKKWGRLTNIKMKQIEVEHDMKKFHDMLNQDAKQRGVPFTEYKHVAVGYLDITEDYPKGSVSQDFIDKLKQICNRGLSLMSCGHHTCERGA